MNLTVTTFDHLHLTTNKRKFDNKTVGDLPDKFSFLTVNYRDNPPTWAEADRSYFVETSVLKTLYPSTNTLESLNLDLNILSRERPNFKRIKVNTGVTQHIDLVKKVAKLNGVNTNGLYIKGCNNDYKRANKLTFINGLLYDQKVINERTLISGLPDFSVINSSTVSTLDFYGRHVIWYKRDKLSFNTTGDFLTDTILTMDVPGDGYKPLFIIGGLLYSTDMDGCDQISNDEWKFDFETLGTIDSINRHSEAMLLPNLDSLGTNVDAIIRGNVFLLEMLINTNTFVIWIKANSLEVVDTPFKSAIPDFVPTLVVDGNNLVADSKSDFRGYMVINDRYFRAKQLSKKHDIEAPDDCPKCYNYSYRAIIVT